MAATDPAALYRVVYSALVEQRLEELADQAMARGDGPAFAASLVEFRRLLALYPQFGDPLIDLTGATAARPAADGKARCERVATRTGHQGRVLSPDLSRDNPLFVG